MKRALIILFNLVSAVLMTFFAIPKLYGKEQSLAGFKQFEDALGIDADGFRIFTGIVEVLIAVLLIYISAKPIKIISIFTYFILGSTMASALFLEFFARPEPKILLVIIALFLLSFSSTRLFQLTKPGEI